MDLYAPCLCGSGKKFKWCCAVIQPAVDRAFNLLNGNQHEAAHKAIEELVTLHPTNPQAWTYQGHFLAVEEEYEAADAALEKALELNPRHPFALYLRGMIRQIEGERIGALLLFRQSTDNYHPNAKEQLSEVFDRIAELEVSFNRPLAARYAEKRAVELMPTVPEYRDRLERFFSDPGRYPVSCRIDWELRKPAPNLPADQAAAWKQTLAKIGPGTSLTDLEQVYSELCQRCRSDATAWFNLGLIRAWRGDTAAIEALDKATDLESDVDRAIEATVLGQIVRCGRGAESQSDWIEYSVIFPLRDGQAFEAFLRKLGSEGRLAAPQVNEETRTLQAMVLMEPDGLVGTGQARVAKLGASLFVIGGIVRLAHPNKESVEIIAREFQANAGLLGETPQRSEDPMHFTDLTAEAFALPIERVSTDEITAAIAREAERFFEGVWPSRSLKSLGGLTPRDAAGSEPMHKKLLGLIRFLQECHDIRCGVDSLAPETLSDRLYDFVRLRRKLGLEGEAPSETMNISEMGAEQLQAMPEDASTADLMMAFRRARQLNADELAAQIGRRLVDRPIEDGQTDRFGVFAFLAEGARDAGDLDEALRLLEQGQNLDAETNSAQRRAEYVSRRGQLLARRGDADAAYAVFTDLFQDEPSDLRLLGTATESMLSLKQGSRAAEFADKGLELARKRNDRDSEGYFLELSEAVKRTS